MQNTLKNNHLRLFWSAIGAVAGAGLNALSAWQGNRMNERIQAENMALQRDINDQNIQLQRDMNAYNNPAAQLQRLRDAGINPSFMSGDAVSPGSQTTVPSLTAPQNMMTATVPDLGSPIASGLANLGSERAQMAAAELSKESAKKTLAETAAVEFQLAVDRRFKVPYMANEIRRQNQEWQIGNERIKELRVLIESGDLDNARKVIENRYLEEEKKLNIKQLQKNLRLTEKQIRVLVQDAALKLAQKKLVNAQEAYQLLVNELREQYPYVFLSGQAGNGIAGLVGFLMDLCGFDKGSVQQFFKDKFGMAFSKRDYNNGGLKNWPGIPFARPSYPFTPEAFQNFNQFK